MARGNGGKGETTASRQAIPIHTPKWPKPLHNPLQRKAPARISRTGTKRPNAANKGAKKERRISTGNIHKKNRIGKQAKTQN